MSHQAFAYMCTAEHSKPHIRNPNSDVPQELLYVAMLTKHSSIQQLACFWLPLPTDGTLAVGGPLAGAECQSHLGLGESQGKPP